MGFRITFFLLVFFWAGPLTAGELLVKKVTAAKHPTLRMYNGQTVRTLALGDEHTFLVVQLWYTMTFKDKKDRFSLSSRDFKLTDEQGTPSRRQAFYDLLGYADRTRSAYLSGRGSDKPGVGYMGFVYPVKKTSKTFQFQIGKITKTLRPTAATVPSLKRVASINIVSARTVESVSESRRLWGGSKGIQAKQEATWKPQAGKILALTLEITGKEPNDTSGHSVLLIHDKFALHTPEKSVCEYLGYRSGSSVNRSGSTRSYRSEGKWVSAKTTLYFRVPDTFKKFSLTYAGHPIASTSTQKGSG
ncbi:MAG: hypothetical protein R3236_07425 [Phycisphaeraceae bacterium]|nr:hypothetical protein [Phycisphaeraceae bacterium]